MSSKQKLFALLIGIDNYHPNSYRVTNLKGCVNDINETERLLKKYYRRLKPNILKLTNAQATYDKIVEQIEQHLIANAEENITLLLWFSGHGSRQDTAQMFYKLSPERKDETLVCYDSRAQVNGQFPYNDLADKELAVLIDRAAQKGAEVVTVFDCCHSGSITRDEEEGGTQIRMVEDRSLPQKAVGNNYLRGYYQKHQLTQVPEGRHIALMACQKNETAKEITLEGTRRGVFSYHLQETLRQNPGITYAQLFNQVKSRIDHYQFNSPQTPQFDAVNLFGVSCAFLTSELVEQPKQRYEVYYSHKNAAWKIKLGAGQGLPQPFNRVRFAIFKEAIKGDKPMGYAKVQSAGMGQSILLIEKLKLTIGETYWGEVASMPQVPLHLNLKVEPKGLAKLQKQMKKKPWRFFDFEALPNNIFDVQINRNSWQLLQGDNILLEDPLEYEEMMTKLDQLGRWHLLLQNRNASTFFTPADFEFTLKSPHQTIEVSQEYQKEVLYCYADHNKSPQSTWATRYEVWAQNNTSQNLYFALLYFTPGYGIQVLQNEPVTAQTTASLLKEGSMNPRGDKVVINRLQLLVSTTKIDSHFFIQPDIIQSPYRYLEEDEEGIEDWCTLTLEFALQKG